MGTRLFVGNISYGTTEAALRTIFEDRGLEVADAVIVTDRETGRSRGFGFVEFSHEAEAQRAQEALDGEDLEGRKMTIREALDRPQRSASARYIEDDRERVPRGSPFHPPVPTPPPRFAEKKGGRRHRLDWDDEW